MKKKYCPNCGSELTIDALFCNKCGEKQVPISSEDAKGESTKPKDESKVSTYSSPTFGRLGMYMLIFSVFILISIIYFYNKDNQLSTFLSSITNISNSHLAGLPSYFSENDDIVTMTIEATSECGVADPSIITGPGCIINNGSSYNSDLIVVPDGEIWMVTSGDIYFILDGSQISYATNMYVYPQGNSKPVRHRVPRSTPGNVVHYSVNGGVNKVDDPSSFVVRGGDEFIIQTTLPLSILNYKKETQARISGEISFVRLRN